MAVNRQVRKIVLINSAPTKSDDHIRWQRLALRPCLGSLSSNETAEIYRKIAELGLSDFLTFLQANRLDQLWREHLAASDIPESFKPWQSILRDSAMQIAAQQLKERHSLEIINQKFRDHAIPYFIFKGANLRYTAYQNPTLRSSGDIDLFVPDGYKLQAAKLLIREGFELHATPDNISHEVSLNKDGICIDLHWHLTRPGRIPMDLTDYLFANRAYFADGIWGLNQSASLLVMLVHPAFTKHLASPNSMLVHMVDLDRLLELDSSDWVAVTEMLGKARLKTAAWSSLYVLHQYSGLDKHREKANLLEPSAIKKKYIRYWIDHRLIHRYFDRPLILRSLFSLSLQDNFRDMLGAVRHLNSAKNLAAKQVLEFQKVDR